MGSRGGIGVVKITPIEALAQVVHLRQTIGSRYVWVYLNPGVKGGGGVGVAEVTPMAALAQAAQVVHQHQTIGSIGM